MDNCNLITDKNNNLTNGLTIRKSTCDLTNCDAQLNQQQQQQSTNNPLSLISKCSQRAFKSNDTDSPWTCPSTNSPQSTKHCSINQCLRKRDLDKIDNQDEFSSTNNTKCQDCDQDDSLLLDIPPEYARDDIELIVDLYIWFEKVRSFLLGLLC